MSNTTLSRNVILMCLAFIAGTHYSFCQNRVVVSIPFKVNSYVIEKEEQQTLDTLAEKCRLHKNFRMKIFAFTDTTGSENYNDMLSHKRIDAVYDYLNSKVPLNEKNTYTSAQGESEEWYDLHFKEAHVQQRFADILLQF